MLAMLPSISEEPPTMEWSEWSDLLSQLPLFPPTAAQPPPAFFPLLSPLLQQKLRLLSLGKGHGWPGALTWLPPELSRKVNERLKSARRSDGLQERFLGYRKFDAELTLASVALEKPGLELWFSWIPIRNGNTASGWKLHDIRLSEMDSDLIWYASISEAKMRFNEPNIHLPQPEPQDSESDDEDSYWSQYDNITSQNAGERPIAFEDPGSREQEPLNYYDRYDNIETSIGDSDLMSVSAAGQHGDVGESMPANRNSLDIGLEDYIRNTVQNLSRLALRSGLPKNRFQELVSEAMK